MNRSERRRLERESEKKKINLGNSINFSPKANMNRQKMQDIAKSTVMAEVAEIQEEARKDAVVNLTSAYILALHDLHGFGKVRLSRVLRKVNNMFEAILDNEITIEDIKQKCEEIKLPYEVIDN